MIPASLNSPTVVAPTTQPGNQPGITPEASEIVRKCVQKLSRQLLISPGNASSAFSSVSLVPLLGMILAAMGHSSKKEEVLGLPEGSLTPTLEKAIHDLLGETSRRYASGNHSAVVSTSFLLSSLPQQSPALAKVLRESYCAETQTISHQSVADATEDLIRKKTEGRIPRLFTGMSPAIRSNMVLTLGNVLLFNGLWSESFDKDYTRPGAFRCADHRTIKNVQMMHLTDRIPSAEYGIYRAIAKDFMPDNDLSLRFVAIQPSDPILTTADELDDHTINALLDSLNEARPEKIKLRIPKIEIDCVEDQLLDKLHRILGIKFTPEELSELRLNPSDHIDISNALRVSLGEKGVRGSVANVLFGVTRSMCSTRCPEFFFDKPGYIAIVDGSGNRLVEATIKDGEYLVTDGPAKLDDTSARTDTSGKRPHSRRLWKNFSDTHPDESSSGESSSGESSDYLGSLPTLAYVDSSSEESTDGPLHPVKEKRALKDSSEIPEVAPKRTKTGVGTPDYRLLLNEQFNADDALYISDVSVNNHFFEISVGCRHDVTLLETRLLDAIGRGYEDCLDIVSFTMGIRAVHKLSISGLGKKRPISHLKKMPN